MTSRIISEDDLATAGFPNVATTWAIGVGLLDAQGHPISLSLPTLTYLNGKLGINNTNPQADLDIKGLLSVEGPTTLSQITYVSGSDPAYLSVLVHPDQLLVSDPGVYTEGTAGVFRIVSNATGTNAETLVRGVANIAGVRSTTGASDYAEAQGSANVAVRGGSDDIGATRVFLNGALNYSYHQVDLNSTAVTDTATGSTNYTWTGAGTINQAIGGSNLVIAVGNAIVTNAYGLSTRGQIAQSGAMVTYYDAYLNGVTSGSPTNRWGLYQAHALHTNYFAAKVGIGTTSPSGMLDVADDRLRVRLHKTPVSASAAGNVGEWCNDDNYFYVCTATNTWKRAALSAW